MAAAPRPLRTHEQHDKRRDAGESPKPPRERGDAEEYLAPLSLIGVAVAMAISVASFAKQIASLAARCVNAARRTERRPGAALTDRV